MNEINRIEKLLKEVSQDALQVVMKVYEHNRLLVKENKELKIYIKSLQKSNGSTQKSST